MQLSPPRSGLLRPRRAGLAVVLTLALLVFAPSALAHAKAHHSSCSHPATARAATSARHPTDVKHPTRTCPAQKGKGHPAKKKRKTGHALAKGGKPAVAGFTPATPASCEDGRAPLRAANGSFSCADESEPSCEDGATPARSANGAELLCPPVQSGGASFCSDGSGGECTISWASTGQPACEDGTAPVLANSGSFACDDGSEPTCESGPAPSPSPDGSELLCEDTAEDS